MIIEDYVSLETTKLLKEKRFDEPCHALYHKGDNKIFFGLDVDSYHNSTLNIDCYACPTLQMAIKWLRNKGFHIYSPMEIDYDEDERGDKWYHDATYYPEIRRVFDGKIMYDDGSLYVIPEQACEVAIKFCLENLI